MVEIFQKSPNVQWGHRNAAFGTFRMILTLPTQKLEFIHHALTQWNMDRK